MAGYGSQGIQGHHLFVQELMEDFGDQFSKLLPGWDVDGEYNLAARASNNKIAASLRVGETHVLFNNACRLGRPHLRGFHPPYTLTTRKFPIRNPLISLNPHACPRVNISFNAPWAENATSFAAQPQTAASRQ